VRGVELLQAVDLGERNKEMMPVRELQLRYGPASGAASSCQATLGWAPRGGC
jgi:hypothetical protein